MEKKIFVPTNDELYIMQDMGINMYDYLLAKVVEVLTIEGVKYPNKGILKTTYKYIKENPEIVYPICRMYPNEIQYSNVAKNDVNLCSRLLNDYRSKEIYSLDNLSYFSDDVSNNSLIIDNVISILNDKFHLAPQYRFEYKDNNLLDSIFSRKLNINSLKETTRNKLINIEPSYLLNISNELITEGYTKEQLLQRAVMLYTMRYGIHPEKNNQYKGMDILTTPDEKTDILIKTLKKNKDNIY